jgi:hypothetical protein
LYTHPFLAPAFPNLHTPCIHNHIIGRYRSFADDLLVAFASSLMVFAIYCDFALSEKKHRSMKNERSPKSGPQCFEKKEVQREQENTTSNAASNACKDFSFRSIPPWFCQMKPAHPVTL